MMLYMKKHKTMSLYRVPEILQIAINTVVLIVYWSLEPDFAGSNPAELDFSGVRKILSMPSFGGEVKESVPRPIFAACKKS